MFNLFRPPRTDTAEETRSAKPRAVKARVIFATFRPGSVSIDLMSKSGTIALDALVPDTLWALAAASQLEKWATMTAEIELRLISAKCSSKAKLTDGRSFMLLDLCREPDLPTGRAIANRTSVSAAPCESGLG